ncbi:MAG: response regulator, partial [Proteocatella sp.]
MNIYTLDDDIQVLRILKKIIEDRKLGNLVGSSSSALDAEKEITRLQPDLVLIDLLMPEKDGLFMVKELKASFPSMEFVMISQVSAKEMVGRAYSYGVEYYIHKPVNALEVESILNKIKGRIEISKKMMDIECDFNQTDSVAPTGNKEKAKEELYLNLIKNVLIQLGIMGEKGSQDIIQICKYCIENEIDLSEVTLRELCHNLSYKPK